MKTLAACLLLFLGARALAQERYTPEQLLAKFYSDLGPDVVDVSSYPKAQRENYAVFRKTCSQCHTLARPLNSPIVKRKEWEKYVERMHLISKEWPKTDVTEADAKALLDFLVFDAKKRKVEDARAFAERTEALKALFKDVQEARLRIRSTGDGSR